MYVYDCKIKHYFPIKQTFSGKYANLESTFNIQRHKTGFRSRKKTSLRFRFNHVYIHAFITSIKRT
jgi:hypothetical protein